MQNGPALLITGGTGFFGKSLLRYLASRKGGVVYSKIYILSRKAEHFRSFVSQLGLMSETVLLAGDICDAKTLPSGLTFDHIIHAAADSTYVTELGQLERFDQIVLGTRNVLDLASVSGCRRFLFTSSGAVYGNKTEPAKEGHALNLDSADPMHAYGIAKLTAEHLCRHYGDKHGFSALVARCFAFFGRDLPLDVHFAIGNFVRDALWRDAITVNGDGTPIRSYMDQDDLACWLIGILSNAEHGSIYNVGSDQSISIINLAELVRDIIYPGKPVEVLRSPSGNSIRSCYVPDITAIKCDLDLSPAISLRESIEHVSRHHQTLGVRL